MRSLIRFRVTTVLIIINIFITFGAIIAGSQSFNSATLRSRDHREPKSKNLNSLVNRSNELEEELHSEILNVRFKVGKNKKISPGREARPLVNFKHFLQGDDGNPGIRSGGMRKFKKDQYGNATVADYFLGFGGHPFSSFRIGRFNSKLEIRDDLIDPRQKRSVLHLYNMVLCATGCNPLSYKGYGCYCGFLGSGYTVDGIDSCCRMHDRCYNTAGCPTFSEYFVPYFWKCYGNLPICYINPGSYNGYGSCGQRLCECDRKLALCLRRYPCPTGKALCTSSPFRLLQNVLTP